MRSWLFILLLTFSRLITPLPAKAEELQDLLTKLKQSRQDTAQVQLLLQIAKAYANGGVPDSNSYYAEQALRLSMLLNDQRGEALARYQLGRSQIARANYLRALEHFLEARNLFESLQDTLGQANCRMQLGVIAYTEKNYSDALTSFTQALPLYLSINELRLASTVRYLSGLCRTELGRYAEAETDLMLALEDKRKLGDEKGYQECVTGLADLFLRQDQIERSRNMYRSALAYFKNSSNLNGEAVTLIGIGRSFLKENHADSAKVYLESALQISSSNRYPAGIMNASHALAEAYERTGNAAKALTMQQQYYTLRDSLFNLESTRQLAELQYQLDLTRKQSEIDLLSKERQIDRFLRIMLITGSALFLILSLLLLQRFRYKQQANRKLEKANQDLNHALDELRNTQEQLVQSEKMASLGQLTAGIAHEIRNPLNFITNFAAVSRELADELNDAGTATERHELSADLKRNLEKIEEHGLRANSIVRSMMLHARQGKGERQTVNLRDLTEENVHLAFHGMRASHPDFDVTLATHLSIQLPALELVQQDISRVLLNLLNNAFYAVRERSKKKEPGFRPTVRIRLDSEQGQAVIRIEDNGIGIASEKLDKIFEPFYTTKPPGEGTGLGLSISHDIVKGHGGSMRANSVGGWTVFEVRLPT